MGRPDFFAAHLTVEKVRAAVRFIDRIKDDDEGAHGVEDDLYREVLTAVAIGQLSGVDAQRAAMAALATADIDFERWCA